VFGGVAPTISGAASSDCDQIRHKRLPIPFTPSAFQPFAEGFDYGLSLAFPGDVRQRLYKLVGLGALYVERHTDSSLVENPSGLLPLEALLVKSRCPTLSEVSICCVYIFSGRADHMDTAKLFANGNSQAVRLPKQYRFSGDEVVVKRLGNAVVLLPKEDPWQVLFDAISDFSPDLMIERDDGPCQDRDPLL